MHNIQGWYTQKNIYTQALQINKFNYMNIYLLIRLLIILAAYLPDTYVNIVYVNPTVSI